MKLFYKNDFRRVLKEKEELNIEFKNYIDEATNEISILKAKNYELLKENSELKNLKLDINAIEDKLRVVSGAKGGLIKENNKLKKELEEKDNEISILRGKISDLQSDRYLIRKIPADKTKSKIKTKIPLPMKSQVRKFMKEKYEYEK